MYQNYDFDKDEKWKHFIKQSDKSMQKYIYNRSAERLDYLKQLWYKENINKKEKLDADKISYVKEESKLPYYIYSTENIFKMSFMIFLFMRGLSQTFGYLFNFLALQRQVRNSTSKERFYKRIVKNEFFHNILFLAAFHFFEGMHNIVIYSPIVMHAWVGVSEFVFLHHKSIYEKLQKWIDKTKQNKEIIMIQKNKAEIIIMPILILAKAFELGNWVLLIFYLMFLKIKYHSNQRSRVAWIQLDYQLESKLPQILVRPYRQMREIGIQCFVQ